MAQFDLEPKDLLKKESQVVFTYDKVRSNKRERERDRETETERGRGRGDVWSREKGREGGRCLVKREREEGRSSIGIGDHLHGL